MTDRLNLIANIAGIMASTVVDAEVRDSMTGDGTIFDPMHSDALLRLFNVNTLGPMRVTNRFVNLLPQRRWGPYVSQHFLGGRFHSDAYRCARLYVWLLYVEDRCESAVKVFAAFPGAAWRARV